MIDLRNTIIRNEILENENPNKIVITVEKLLNFNKQKNGKWLPSDLAKQLKILTPKRMLQRLPIPSKIAQVKVGNTYRKRTRWNQTNHIFFVSSKGNY